MVRSSACCRSINEGGECLEAAAIPGTVHIRDFKAPKRAQRTRIARAMKRRLKMLQYRWAKHGRS